MLHSIQEPQQQIQIKISDEIMKGFYANTMFVSHTGEEFAMDFISTLAAPNQGVVGAKIITSPGHMKRIVDALQDNIKKYEDQFGTIKTAAAPEAQKEIGFSEKK
jgi:hypothetical protein